MTVTAITPIISGMAITENDKPVSLRSAQYCVKYAFGEYVVSCAYDTGGLSRGVAFGVTLMRRSYIEISKSGVEVTKIVARAFPKLSLVGTEIVMVDDANDFLDILNYVKKLSEA